MQKLVEGILWLAFLGGLFLIMALCLSSMQREYVNERNKAFIASCEFNGGKVVADSYGTLHCVPDITR